MTIELPEAWQDTLEVFDPHLGRPVCKDRFENQKEIAILSETTTRSNICAWKLAPGPVHRLQAVPLPGDVQSLDQASAQLPAGAYTTFRTFFGKKALRLVDHLARLEVTASHSGKIVALDETAVRRAIREAIAGYWDRLHPPETGAGTEAVEDVRVRLTLSLDTEIPELYVLVDRLVIPAPQEYKQGVAVLTTKLKRDHPEEKLTSFIEQSIQVRQEQLSKVNEVLMVDEAGFILEGISSNFFGVWDGTIYTAGAGVLMGITRAQVLEQAEKCAGSVRFEPVHVRQVPLLDEAFISSSSRGVLPVRQIDQQMIGGGGPGPVTRCLMQAYARLIAERAEPI